MHHLNLILVCLLLLFSSCENDEKITSNAPSFSDINVVAGLHLLDDNLHSLGQWRSPNNKLLSIQVYPNPSNGNINVIGFNAFDRIWLIPADCLIDTTTIDIYDQTQSLEYSTADIIALQVKDITLTSTSRGIVLDFSDVNAGFYRLF